MSSTAPGDDGVLATLNIDDFCRDVAVALLQLASRFPRPYNLFVEDVYQPEETDEFGLHSERFLACFSALSWLHDEGYIRYEQALRMEAVEQAVLTARSLTLLVTPQSDEGDPTIALEKDTLLARLRAALRAGSSTELRWAVIELMNKMNGGRQ